MHPQLNWIERRSTEPKARGSSPFGCTKTGVFNEKNVKNVEVICEDKGALDYTIKARLLVALARMEG